LDHAFWFFPRDYAFKFEGLWCPEGEAAISSLRSFRGETDQATCY